MEKRYPNGYQSPMTQFWNKFRAWCRAVYTLVNDNGNKEKQPLYIITQSIMLTLHNDVLNKVRYGHPYSRGIPVLNGIQISNPSPTCMLFWSVKPAFTSRTYFAGTADKQEGQVYYPLYPSLPCHYLSLPPLYLVKRWSALPKYPSWYVHSMVYLSSLK